MLDFNTTFVVWYTFNMEKKLTRTQIRALQMRDQIIEIASEILAESGSSALTAEAVASKADIAVQTVYNRVGGRNDLLVAASELSLRKNQFFFESAYKSKGTVLERVNLILKEHIRFAVECPNQFLLTLFPPKEVISIKKLQELIDLQNTQFAELLLMGMKNGELNPNMNPEVTAITLWAMTNGVLALLVRNDEMKITGDLREKILEDLITKIICLVKKTESVAQ